MTITMLKSKIHRATVTQAEIDYVGSITIDSALLKASGIVEYEKVQVVAGILSPALREKVELYEGVPDMFDLLGLETAIEKALSRKVWMKNGGYAGFFSLTSGSFVI